MKPLQLCFRTWGGLVESEAELRLALKQPKPSLFEGNVVDLVAELLGQERVGLPLGVG